MPEAMAASWHTLQTSVQMTLQATEPQQEKTDKDAAEKQKKQDKILKVWNKTSYSHPRQAMPGDFYYTSEKSLSEINCTTRTIKLLQKIYYDSDDSEVKNIRHGEATTPELIVPDTPAELVFDFSCSFTSPKASPQGKNRLQPRQKSQTAPTKPVAGKEGSKEKETTPTTTSSKPVTKPASSTKPATTQKKTSS